MTRAIFAALSLFALGLFLAFAGDKLAGPNVEAAQLARWDAELAVDKLTGEPQ